MSVQKLEIRTKGELYGIIKTVVHRLRAVGAHQEAAALYAALCAAREPGPIFAALLDELNRLQESPVAHAAHVETGIHAAAEFCSRMGDAHDMR